LKALKSKKADEQLPATSAFPFLLRLTSISTGDYFNKRLATNFAVSMMITMYNLMNITSFFVGFCNYYIASMLFFLTQNRTNEGRSSREERSYFLYRFTFRRQGPK